MDVEIAVHGAASGGGGMRPAFVRHARTCRAMVISRLSPVPPRPPADRSMICGPGTDRPRPPTAKGMGDLPASCVHSGALDGRTDTCARTTGQVGGNSKPILVDSPRSDGRARMRRRRAARGGGNDVTSHVRRKLDGDWSAM